SCPCLACASRATRSGASHSTTSGRSCSFAASHLLWNAAGIGGGAGGAVRRLAVFSTDPQATIDEQSHAIPAGRKLRFMSCLEVRVDDAALADTAREQGEVPMKKG